MNIGVSELVIVAAAIACLGIVVGGVVVAVFYFVDKRHSGDEAG